jgi:hypothetical protein
LPEFRPAASRPFTYGLNGVEAKWDDGREDAPPAWSNWWPQPDTEAAGKLQTKISAEVVTLRIGAPVADKDFRLDFPEGTQVQDFRIGEKPERETAPLSRGAVPRLERESAKPGDAKQPRVEDDIGPEAVPGVILAGRVATEDGLGLGGARVWVRHGNTRQDSRLVSAMTDDQGRFEFKLPKAGASNRPTALVPRKPERFDTIAEKLTRAGIAFTRRTSLRALSLPGVLLLDTIGELAALFDVANVVFMGGTLAMRGGHNILEPAYFGNPIIVGPHMENFAAIAEECHGAGAVKRIDEPGALEEVEWRTGGYTEPKLGMLVSNPAVYRI